MQIPFRLQAKPFIVPPCAEELQILHQDEHFLLVVKPAGLLTVPGRLPDNRDSMLSRLQVEHPTAVVVHRLDLDTSGLLIVGLSPLAASEFGKQFQARSIDKEYIAIVDGLVAQDSGRVDVPLIADWPNRPLQKVCYETGKPSITDFEVIARDESKNQTRIRLKPITGRSHQLRVHMRELGHAIVGCDMYAPDDVCYAGERLMLHARWLRFQHPVTKLWMEMECEPGF